MATHRYTLRNGRGFFVRLNNLNKGYCDGSRAQAIDCVPHDRVQCPVCGRVCAVSSRGRIWAHCTPSQLEENIARRSLREHK
jgi:hypothetical protein